MLNPLGCPHWSSSILGLGDVTGEVGAVRVHVGLLVVAGQTRGGTAGCNRPGNGATVGQPPGFLVDRVEHRAPAVHVVQRLDVRRDTEVAKRAVDRVVDVLLQVRVGQRLVLERRLQVGVHPGVQRAGLQPLVEVVQVGDVVDRDLVKQRLADLIGRLVPVGVALERDARVRVVLGDLERAGRDRVLGVVLAVVLGLRDRRGRTHRHQVVERRVRPTQVEGDRLVVRGLHRRLTVDHRLAVLSLYGPL